MLKRNKNKSYVGRKRAKQQHEGNIHKAKECVSLSYPEYSWEAHEVAIRIMYMKNNIPIQVLSLPCQCQHDEGTNGTTTSPTFADP
jgi:hypothetical protein